MREVIGRLKREYPDVRCFLDHESPWQLLQATILSAQCTDARVNMVTPALFKAYPDARAMARAKLKDVEKLIQSTGFFRNKAVSLIESSKTIVEQHGGELPRNLEALTALRGVGRKTANVVLGNAFGIAGLVVDTHVGRLCRRLGFTQETDPVKVEHAMMKLVPKEDWVVFSHLLISHGRAICDARKPLCDECMLKDRCPRIGVVPRRA